MIELLSTMYYSLTIYTHTSIKRPSRRPYIFQQDRNLPSPAALLLDVRPLLGCWMDSKQIGEAGPALKDRKTLRAGSESGGGKLIENEGELCTYYTHSSIAIPKWSMHIWTLTTGGRISRTKEAYVRHACASVALFYPFRFLLQSFSSSSFRRNTLVGGVEGDVADSMAYIYRHVSICVDKDALVRHLIIMIIIIVPPIANQSPFLPFIRHSC